jgi:hypothetical protein
MSHCTHRITYQIQILYIWTTKVKTQKTPQHNTHKQDTNDSP